MAEIKVGGGGEPSWATWPARPSAAGPAVQAGPVEGARGRADSAGRPLVFGSKVH